MRVYCLVPLIQRDKMITGCQSLGRKEGRKLALCQRALLQGHKPWWLWGSDFPGWGAARPPPLQQNAWGEGNGHPNPDHFTTPSKNKSYSKLLPCRLMNDPAFYSAGNYCCSLERLLLPCDWFSWGAWASFISQAVLSVRRSCCHCPLTLPWVVWSICWPPWSSGSHSQENPNEAEVCQGLVRTWLVCLCKLNTLYISSLPIQLSVLAQADQVAEKVPLWQLSWWTNWITEPKNPRIAQAGRDLERSSAPTFVGKGHRMRFSSILSNHILKTFGDGDSTTSLGRLFQWMTDLTVRNSCIMMKPVFVQLLPLAPLSSPHGSLSIESFHPPCGCSFSAGILCEGPLSHLFPGRKGFQSSLIRQAL